MSESADLIIRRAKALLATIDERKANHKKLVAANKRGEGRHAGQGPTLNDFGSQFLSLRASISDHDGDGGHSPIPFTREIVESPGSSDTVERHESFGLLSFSRTHGGPGRKLLFGSHVETHPTTIVMKVRRGERVFSNDLSYDRYHGREHLIEIEMSNAQFADAITLMNHGQGIPCTIKHVGLAAMENVPAEHRSEQHTILSGFRKRMKDVRATAAPLVDKLTDVLAKKSIGKKDRETIAGLFERLLRDQTSSASFTLDQFNDAASKLETAAKREVEAYANAILINAGIGHLRDRAIGESGDVPAITAAVTQVHDGSNSHRGS